MLIEFLPVRLHRFRHCAFMMKNQPGAATRPRPACF